MRQVQPILFLTKDAPPLGIPLDRAIKVITMHFAHVASWYLDKVGQTFLLLPGVFHRGANTQSYYLGVGVQHSVFRELGEEGVIPLCDTQKVFYAMVWGPSEDVGIVGECGSDWWCVERPTAGRCMDGPSCVKDALRLPKTGSPAGKSWSLQWKGRVAHELGHAFGLGDHSGGIMSEWWSYPLPNFTASQVTTLRANPFLWVK